MTHIKEQRNKGTWEQWILFPCLPSASRRGGMVLGFLVSLFLLAAPPVHAADPPFSVIDAIRHPPTGSCPSLCGPGGVKYGTGLQSTIPQGCNGPGIVYKCKLGYCLPPEAVVSVGSVDQAKTASGNVPCNYSLEDIVGTGVRVAQFIFGITGSLMLLMFVYGGFKMVTAAGNAEKIQAAQKVLTAAIIGGIIILGAVVFVREIIKLMGIDVGGTPGLGTIEVVGGQ